MTMQQDEITSATMPSWARKLFDAGLDDTDRNHRYEVLEGIQSLGRTGHQAQIDDLLRSAKVSELSERALICILRGSYMYRNTLTEWFGFRDLVATELEVRGASPQLMMGLYGPTPRP